MIKNDYVYKYNVPASEMANIIYDTLMHNVGENYPQFDISNVGECEIDNNTDRITFDYAGKKFELRLYAI